MPGHWEGDLLIGKRNLTAIGTLVERSTGYTMLLHLPEGYRPEQVRDALAAKIQTLPEQLRGSLTWDQGRERPSACGEAWILAARAGATCWGLYPSGRATSST